MKHPARTNPTRGMLRIASLSAQIPDFVGKSARCLRIRMATCDGAPGNRRCLRCRAKSRVRPSDHRHRPSMRRRRCFSRRCFVYRDGATPRTRTSPSRPANSQGSGPDASRCTRRLPGPPGGSTYLRSFLADSPRPHRHDPRSPWNQTCPSQASYPFLERAHSSPIVSKEESRLLDLTFFLFI